MVVTITVAELAEANRVGSTTREQSEVTRLRDYAIAVISQHLGTEYDDTPDVVLNLAAAQLVGYLYDKPTVSGGVSLANAFKFSGAGQALFPYRIHHVGLVGGDLVAAAQAAIGTDNNPVVDVTIVGADLVVEFADGTEERHVLPAAGGGTGVDQTARDSAATNATAIALRLQRGDVSPGTGIEITPTAGSTTGLTISAVGTTSGPAMLTGGWTWITLTPQAGEVMPSDTVVPPAIDTWIFNTTGATYADDRAALLALAIGATIRFEQNATRYQVVTLTEIPTLSGNNVTVTGSGSRTGGFEQLGPGSFGTVTITLTPGVVDPVDQTARTAAATAQTEIDAHELTAHNTDTTARATAGTAQSEIDAHELTTHNTDTTARGNLTTHIANHPTGLPAGSSQLRELKWNANTSAWDAVSDVSTVYYGATAMGDYVHVAAGLNTAGTRITTTEYLLYKGFSANVLRNDHLAALWAAISSAPVVFVLAPAHTEWINNFNLTLNTGPLDATVTDDFVYINGTAYDIKLATHTGVEADVGSAQWRYTTPASVYAISQTAP